VTEYKQLERPNYFHGKLLTAADFAQEQQYHLERSRRSNRFLHGWGIVSGLAVRVVDGTTLVVAPGLALDCAGNELVLAAPECITLANLTGKHWLTICYAETPVGQLPGTEESTEFSHIHEGARVELSCTNPAMNHRGMLAGTPGCGHTHALCIAALDQRAANWRVTPVKGSRLPRARK
jgi:hypothetical protein